MVGFNIFRSRSRKRAKDKEQAGSGSGSTSLATRPSMGSQQTPPRPRSANSQRSVRRPFARELPEADEAAPAPNIGRNRPHTQYLPEIETGQPWFAMSPPQRSPGKSTSNSNRRSWASNQDVPFISRVAGSAVPPVPRLPQGQVVDTSVNPTEGQSSRPNTAGGSKTPIADEFSMATRYKDGQRTPLLDLGNLNSGQDVETKGYTPLEATVAKMPGYFPAVAQEPSPPSSQTRETSVSPPATEPAIQQPSVGSNSIPTDLTPPQHSPIQTAESKPPQLLYDQKVATSDVNGSRPTSKSGIPRQSLEKPLPPPAVTRQVASGDYTEFSRRPFSKQVLPNGTTRPIVRPDLGDAIHPAFRTKLPTRSGQQTVYNRDQKLAVEGAKEPPSLQGIVNLENSEDTTVHKTVAKPIVHETVVPKVHHVREERITREIHNDHIHHRILPIVDVQVLPAKHYVRSSDAQDGEYIEVPASALPARAWDPSRSKNWVIAETVTRLRSHGIEPGQDKTKSIPRQFTARAFAPGEGDFKSYERDGHPVTETTWIHPPRIEEGGRLTGQTLPLDLGRPLRAAHTSDTPAQKAVLSATDKMDA